VLCRTGEHRNILQGFLVSFFLEGGGSKREKSRQDRKAPEHPAELYFLFLNGKRKKREKSKNGERVRERKSRERRERRETKKTRETYIPSHVPQIWTIEDQHFKYIFYTCYSLVGVAGSSLASPGSLGIPERNKVALLGDCGRPFFAKGRPREPGGANNQLTGT